MPYSFKILNCFKRQLKSYTKKFPHIKNDLIHALQGFSKETASSLGFGNYKIRIHSSDLKKGKNKSFRLVLHCIEVDSIIIPLSLYFKGDKATLSEQEILQALEIAMMELEELS